MIVVAVMFVAGFLLGELWRVLASRGREGNQPQRDHIALIGDRKVSPEEYRNAVSYVTAKYRENNQLRDLSTQDYSRIDDEAWDFLVSEVTWNKLFERTGTRVSHEEVMEIIKANPPEDLRKNPELLTEAGEFDQEKYLQALNNPQNQVYFQRYYRDMVEALPKEKVRIDAVNSFRLTNPEIAEAMLSENAAWKTTSLYIGPRAITQNVESTEAEARAYFEAHPDEFRSREIRAMRYVTFPVGMSADDSADAKEIVDRAHKQLRAGETFNMTMLDFSDLVPDTFAPYFPRERLDGPTDSVVGSLKVGETSEPFLTEYGWQLVVLDSLSGDSVALRRILIRFKMGPENVANVLDEVRDFVERSDNAPFDTVAADMDLAIRAARPMVGGEANMAGLDITSASQLTDWARKAKPGDVMNSPVRGRSGYYVFQLEEVRPAADQTFEEARKQAELRAQRELEREAWTDMAVVAKQELDAGVSIEDYVAVNPDVEVMTDEFVGVAEARRNKGAELAGALLALDAPGQIVGPIATGWGAFIIRCDEFTTGEAATVQQVAQTIQQNRAQGILAELLAGPEVKDYRDPFSY